MEPWSRPVPSRRQFHVPLTRTVPSRQENISCCTLPSRPDEEISPYRPVSSTKPAPTVPSRRENLSLPFHPAIHISPYRPVSSTKPAPTVPSRRENVPIPSRPDVKSCPYRSTPLFIAVTPSRRETVNTNFDLLVIIRTFSARQIYQETAV